METEAIIRVDDRDDQLTITIADRGRGVPEEALETLFNPSTGERTQGTERAVAPVSASVSPATSPVPWG